ncbi:MAG: lysophospholipid acyltransferase family protein [Fimbriimonadaceae bacterium]|nr:lysophospholipid acyltransferase family protein [Fimbriimonadaceae bacterium]
MGSWQKRLEGWAAARLLHRLRRRLTHASAEEIEETGARWASRLRTFSGKRITVALENLGRAFPESSTEWRNETADASIRHFAIVAADFLAGADRNLSDLQAMVSVQGEEHIQEALRQGKGALLAGGHFGHFELSGAYLSLSGYPVNVVIRDADDEGVNAIVNELRRRPGTRIIPRGNAARPILEALQRNELVGVLSDQNHDDAYLPFFDVPAGTNLGMGVIQERTGSPLIAVSTPRIGVGRYEIRITPPLPIGEPTGTKGEAPLLAINQWLEGVIREHPEQWLWIHDRWRSAKRRGMA